MVALLVSLVLAVGCSRTPTDAKLTSDVQSQIQADQSITNKDQVTVQASGGVITLSGTVASDAERSLAGIDAGKVAGVKTVVNNLQSAPPVVAQTPPPVEEAPAVAPAPTPAPEKKEHKRAKPNAGRSNDQNQAPPPAAPVVAQNEPPAQQAAPPPPPPPPPVQKVTIPDGTQLAVRLVEALDSGRNHGGDVFHGTLSQPIVVGDKVVIPANSDVTGQVTDAKDAGHFSGNSSLALKLTTLTVNGKTYQISTEEFSQQGKGRGKNTAAKVGGGAAVGRADRRIDWRRQRRCDRRWRRRWWWYGCPRRNERAAGNAGVGIDCELQAGGLADSDAGGPSQSQCRFEWHWQWQRKR